MKKLNIIILIAVCFLSCNNKTENNKMKFLTEIIPTDTPIEFKENLTPNDKLIHKGIFSPDLEEYYYTISDKSFDKFDVYIIKKLNGI